MSAVPVLMRAQTIGLRVAGRLAKPFELEELEAMIERTLNADRKT
jgi:hypothetical protein